jgi:hypothetical protein
VTSQRVGLLPSALVTSTELLKQFGPCLEPPRKVQSPEAEGGGGSLRGIYQGVVRGREFRSHTEGLLRRIVEVQGHSGSHGGNTTELQVSAEGPSKVYPGEFRCERDVGEVPTYMCCCFELNNMVPVLKTCRLGGFRFGVADPVAAP